MNLTITEDATHGRTILGLRPELDIACASDVGQQLLMLLEGRMQSRLLLDLSELEFIDSSGIAVLVKAEKRARSIGCTLALVAPRPAVERVLQICGLDQHFVVFESFTAAAGKNDSRLPTSNSTPAPKTSAAKSSRPGES